MNQPTTSTWSPELIYLNGRFQRGQSLSSNASGKVEQVFAAEQSANRLNGRALLPGLVNAHSHAFQRVLRGRTEYKTTQTQDSFWTWREMMYSAVERLGPEDIYDASRMAFLEMALSGITAVGEFHYLHYQPDGKTYADPNLLAKQVVRAARDVGLRIALLRVAYARSGYQVEDDPRQKRFIDKDVDAFLRSFESLNGAVSSEDGTVWTGVAPHSVRALPLNYLKEVIQFANELQVPVHMHVAEQPAEVNACIAEYGLSPVSLLDSEGLLSDKFTAVHAIHISPVEVERLGKTKALVCACPTTERNLGDGVVPADALMNEGVRISLGTDSHAQIDLLEDARELEYHLRLEKKERAVLAPSVDQRSGLATRLFECATLNGAESIGATSGSLQPGQDADFFTVYLNDPSLAGSSEDDLLSTIVFTQSRTAVRDVVVGGKTVVQDGRHKDQDEIIDKFQKLQNKLWGKSS